MKIFLISDNTDAQTGFRLAGVDSVMAHTRSEFESALNNALADSEIGIILVMEQLCKNFPGMINDIRTNRHLPLIVEIPDRHGTGRQPDFVEAYIREAIGVKL